MAMKKGRQPFVAAVSGEVDGVPFTNYFKYPMTAMRNAQDNRNFILHVLETAAKYSWHPSRAMWIPLSLNAPEQPW